MKYNRRQGKLSDPENHLMLYLREAVTGHSLRAFPCSKTLQDGSRGVFLAGYGTFSLFKKMVGLQNLLSFREGNEKAALHIS